MKRELGVAMVVAMAAAPMAAAGNDEARRAERKDAPRLMKEAVRTGTADAADFAAIVDWILHEKEEKVAAGLVEVIGAVEPAMADAAGERWNGTTRAMLSLFTSVLRDAASNRRRGADAFDADVSALVTAAAPAVAAALSEADPVARARFLAALDALGPVVDDLGPLLGADARAAARDALKTIESK